MKTVQTIEKELAEVFASLNEDREEKYKVTFLGITGVVRGIFTAMAYKLREVWHDYTQLKRKLFINTCSGSDLDIYVEERGIERRGANPSGALILFKGVDTTVVPINTVITDPVSKKTYETRQQITLGSKNNDFVYDGNINIDSVNIGDIAWAECTEDGVIGNTQSDSLISVSLADITAVTNPAPTQGGKDIESDDDLRSRMKNYTKVLNHNTQAYYEAVCQDLDIRVLRTLAHKDHTQPDAIIITIVTKSGVPLTAAELNTLADNIYDAQQSFTKITCNNMAFTLITVSERVKLKEVNGVAVDNDKYFVDTADYLANYFDWSKWEFGQNISLDDVLLVCESVPQTDDIQLSSFMVNGSDDTTINIPENSLPYFSSLIVNDITGSVPVEKSNTDITQSFENLEIQTKELR
jgi:mannose/fructose/N-acetylgalactosamine-specific phosphotransferase system component IIB